MALGHTLTNATLRPNSPPGGVVDVLVASKDGKRPAGLEYIPWETRVLVDSRAGWSNSANALLSQSAEAGHDAIFIDDDVTILPETFAGFDRYYPQADVFGFRLKGHPGQKDQAGCGLQTDNPFPDLACYVAHVTASLMYVRADVLSKGAVRFPNWPGIHFEDIAFTYECWLRGFAVAYLPLPALHDIYPATGGMVGATKRHDPNLVTKREINHKYLTKWVNDHKVKQAAEVGRIPLGIWGVCP